MTIRTWCDLPETASGASTDLAWQGALASDAALVAYLRRFAELRASELGVQDSSCSDSYSDISRSAARWGSLKLGPNVRARNSLGLTPVQRRKAR
jgi:hypothetical protein